MHRSSSRTSTAARTTSRLARGAGALLLAALLAATGCSADGDKAAGSSADHAAAGQEKGGAGAGAGAGAGKGSGSDKAPREASDPVGVHIVRTASLTVRVKDVPDALDSARAAAQDAGGLVGEESTDRDGDGHDRSRLVLRVPQAEYEKVLAALEGTGELVERNACAEDVTEQVVDVESRVKSQRASVARVRELMDRATEISDVVALEGELSSRQAELESLLAQQASLKDRTSLATITLTLTEKSAPQDGDDEAPGFLTALSGGWHAFVTVLRWIAVALGATLPFLATLALLTYLIRRFGPRRHTPRTSTGTGTGTGTGDEGPGTAEAPKQD